MGLRTIKEVAVEALEAAADHTAKRGYFVELASGKASVCNAATGVPYGLILDGEAAGGMDSVAILGGNVGTVRVKVSGNVAKGAKGKLAADGTALAAGGGGARVEVCKFVEAGATDELVEAILLEPVVYAS